jgi:hypothetical protein
MGYMAPVLKEKFAKSKIIALHIEDGFPSVCEHEYCGKDVQDFLEKEVPETDAANIKIIEWRPSLNYYKEAYLNLLSQAADFIKRMDAGKRTTAAFGKKWFGNFFKNLGNVKQTLLYKPIPFPVIITGSGPSLEKTLPVIRKMQESSFIIAASSSVMALCSGGINPDIVITTDGGTWALRHIYPYFRSAIKSAFAANLCAALPSQCGAIPFLIINDGSYWQNVVLHALSLPSVIIPQRGTVTASAVELALVLSSANIYLAGMDLCVKDLRSHAKPYAFDHLLYDKASRFAPVYSQSFARSSQIHDGGSYDIYAAWFKKQFSVWPKRISYLDASAAQEREKKNIAGYFKAADVKDTDSFRDRGIKALLEGLKNREYADNLRAELGALLFPGEKDVPFEELAKEVLLAKEPQAGARGHGGKED